MNFFHKNITVDLTYKCKWKRGLILTPDLAIYLTINALYNISLLSFNRKVFNSICFIIKRNTARNEHVLVFLCKLCSLAPFKIVIYLPINEMIKVVTSYNIYDVYFLLYYKLTEIYPFGNNLKCFSQANPFKQNDPYKRSCDPKIWSFSSITASEVWL